MKIILLALLVPSLVSCALRDAGEDYYKDGPGKERVWDTMNIAHDVLDEVIKEGRGSK